MSGTAPAFPSGREAGAPVAVSDRYLLPYLLHRVSARFTQQWRAELGGRGPTIHRWQVLAILSVADGLRVRHIVELADIAQPVLSRVLDQMERDGLVVRRAVDEDLRGVAVWTTPQGRSTFRALMPRAAALVDNSLAAFDDNDIQTLQELLARLLASMEDGDVQSD